MYRKGSELVQSIWDVCLDEILRCVADGERGRDERERENFTQEIFKAFH